MKKTIAAFALLGLAAFAYAVGISNPFVHQPALAYSKRYSVDLQAANVNTIAATAVYSSATIANSSFSTGQVSTGSFLVTDNTILGAAKATDSIEVASVDGSTGDSIVIAQLNKPGAYVFIAGRDWNYKATAALTAASIKLALDKVPYIVTSRSGAILYSTATTNGPAYNSIIVQTNNSSTLTISSPTFLGGRLATTVSVNGYNFMAGRDFTVGGSAAATATAIKNAVNAKAGLSGYMLADTATSSVTLVSTKVGTLYNMGLASSNSSAVAPLHPTMIGGANEAWTLNSKNITVAAHGLSLAYPVLYRLGSGAPAISGLTGETTYYAIPVDANTIKLADSSAHAQSGTAITLASTSTLTAAKSYSLLALPFTAAATTGFKWQGSTDNSNWTDLSASTVSWIAGGGAGTTNWNLGQIPYRYLGLNVVAPATGGLTLDVTVTGTYTAP